MARIYTRAGDGGTTERPGGADGGERSIRKDDPLLEAIGTIDELSCALGLCRAAAQEAVQADLARAQQELFDVAGMLYAARHPGGEAAGVCPQAVARMEARIDAVWRALPELHAFILPGGGELAARLHVARAVCRRAERRVVAFAGERMGDVELPLRYLNRLSDLLFALARAAAE